MNREYEADARRNDLPILEWEVFERRILLPPDLRRLVHAPTRIVRVRIEVDEKLRTKHPATLFIYDRLSEYSAFWEEWRGLRDAEGYPRWQIFQHIPDNRYGKVYAHMTVVGRDREGSFNLISSHRRDESYLRRLRQVGELHRRGEE